MHGVKAPLLVTDLKGMAEAKALCKPALGLRSSGLDAPAKDLAT